MNFNTLSAKQIKTYAAAIIMSILSIEAMASTNVIFENRDPGMIGMEAVVLDEELFIESWMTAPFATQSEEEEAMGNNATVSTEILAESELAIESWMTAPFAIQTEEEVVMENSAIVSTEILAESEIAIESWMTAPFEIPETKEISTDYSTCTTAP